MITLITGTIKQCKCENPVCGYEWETIAKRNPSICPKCRSREWNGKKITGRPTTSRITMPAPKRVRIEGI